MSSFPNWVGSEQMRFYELSGDELVLRTAPLLIGGDSIVNELRWRREEL
jgi:Lipocalin-like domain